MDDLVLKAEIDDGSTLYVSTIDRQTYKEHIGEDTLGGDEGYFVIRTRNGDVANRFELLAKAASFAAAGDLFDLIVKASRQRRILA